MTIPEVNREIKAWNWREKRQNTFICSNLYKLPTLIGIAVLDSKNYPEIYEVFPDYFDEKEIKEMQYRLQVQKDMDTFKAWAEAFNKRMEERNE